MRSHLILAGMAGLMAPIASASTTCTSSNATPIEKYISESGGGGGGGGGGGFDVFLSYDPFAVLSNAVKHKRAARTPNARLANVANIILAPRDGDSAPSATCSDTEMCLSVQTSPFCLDVTNGDFHDGQGTTGNALSGDYTLGDGRKGNLYKGPYPQPTAAGGGGAAAAQTTAASSSSSGGGDDSGNVSETAVPTPGTGAGTGMTGGAAATETGAAPAATTTAPNAGASGQVDRMVMGGAAALLGALLV